MSELTPAQEDMRRRLDEAERVELLTLRKLVRDADKRIERAAEWASEALRYLPNSPFDSKVNHARNMLFNIQRERFLRADFVRTETSPRFDANGCEVSP